MKEEKQPTALTVDRVGMLCEVKHQAELYPRKALGGLDDLYTMNKFWIRMHSFQDACMHECM